MRAASRVRRSPLSRRAGGPPTAPRISRGCATGWRRYWRRSQTCWGTRELPEELLVQAAEAAVAHDEHVIARTNAACELAREGGDIARGVAAAAEGREHRTRVPTEICRRVEPYLVRALERRGERVPMHSHAHGVRARLEHRDDARRLADAAAQAVDRGGDGGGMMRKVVVHAYAAHLA